MKGLEYARVSAITCELQYGDKLYGRSESGDMELLGTFIRHCEVNHRYLIVQDGSDECRVFKSDAHTETPRLIDFYQDDISHALAYGHRAARQGISHGRALREYKETHGRRSITEGEKRLADAMKDPVVGQHLKDTITKLYGTPLQ